MAKKPLVVDSDGVVLQDEYGHEVPDPTPVEMPLGFKRPETLAEQVQRLVRGEISRRAQDAGEETFEDSEDFDVDGDDGDPTTPYEEFFDPVLGRGYTAQELREHEQVIRSRYLAAQKTYFDEMDRMEVLKGEGRGSRPSPRDGADPSPQPDEVKPQK